MTPLLRHLDNYGDYHRDRRNVATHLAGVPMILLAVEILLSRPVVEMGGLIFNPAMVASVLATLWYLRVDLRFGLVMGGVLALCVWVGVLLAQMATSIWLGTGLALFIIGWALQFLGHHYEGRKPAFMDDIRGLLVGPLFVLAEMAFMLGFRDEVQVELKRVEKS